MEPRARRSEAEMASINVHTSKDGKTTYYVRIRRRGEQTQSATFPTRKDAQQWATMIEGQMIEGRHFPQRKPQHTLSELLERYTQDIMPRKTEETQRSQMSVIHFWREQLGHKLLTEFARADVIQGRDALKGKAPGTIHKYLVVLTHALNIAVREYGWIDTNVASTVSRPPLPPGRVRFLTDEERSRLLLECKRSKNQHLYALVSLALYTGLRRGALLHLRRQDIDLKNRILTIPKTKNKSTLVLPLVGEACNTIKSLLYNKHNEDYIFPGQDARGRWGSYSSAFEQAVKRANISNFSFHCLRHTSASYLIQSGVPLYVIGTILNHKNPSTITHRYAHLDTSNLKGALEILAQRLEG